MFELFIASPCGSISLQDSHSPVALHDAAGNHSWLLPVRVILIASDNSLPLTASRTPPTSFGVGAHPFSQDGAISDERSASGTISQQSSVGTSPKCSPFAVFGVIFCRTDVCFAKETVAGKAIELLGGSPWERRAGSRRVAMGLRLAVP